MLHANATRRRFLAGAAGAVLPGAAQSSRRPNILFLLADDQRADALGCMRNTIIRTPVIDRLAAEGVSFSNNFCATAMRDRSKIWRSALDTVEQVPGLPGE